MPRRDSLGGRIGIELWIKAAEFTSTSSLPKVERTEATIALTESGLGILVAMPVALDASLLSPAQLYLPRRRSNPQRQLLSGLGESLAKLRTNQTSAACHDRYVIFQIKFIQDRHSNLLRIVSAQGAVLGAEDGALSVHHSNFYGKLSISCHREYRGEI